MAEGISLREFGRQLGVSGEYVRRAVADGKIPADCVGEITLRSGNKRPVITNPERAAEHWGRNRDPNQVRDKAVMAAGARRGWAQRRGEAPPPEDEDGDDDEGQQQPTRPLAANNSVGDVPGLPSINQSKQRTEAYKAMTARLDYEERLGSLVNAQQVKAKFVGMVTTAKTKLLGVPTKAKARIPTLTMRDIELLEDLIAEALEEIAIGD